MLKFIKCQLLIFCLCFFSLDGAEYWQRVQAVFAKCGPLTFATQGEIRFRHFIHEAYHYQLREINTYKFCENLEFALTPVYILTKPLHEKLYRNEYRLEFEVNPTWKINPNVSLKLRNRFDIRKREGVSSFEKRIRLKQTFIFPVKQEGKLIDFRPSNEVFYNFNEKRFNENRFIPFEITLQLSKEVQFRPFIMIRTQFRDFHYKSRLIIGSDLLF